MTGFGVRWADLDADGYLDLFVANGAVTREEELAGQFNAEIREYKEANPQ